MSSEGPFCRDWPDSRGWTDKSRLFVNQYVAVSNWPYQSCNGSPDHGSRQGTDDCTMAPQPPPNGTPLCSR